MQPDGENETVVLVHGIWMTGADMFWLRRRVQRCGYHTVQFRYYSLRATVEENAARLHALVRELAAVRVHFVAHSLGGLVVLRYLYDVGCVRLGRVVLLGSPCLGSAAARAAGGHGWSRWLLGRAAEDLQSGAAPWRGDAELGAIAGDLSMGIGRFLLRDLPRPNDGTVSAAETRVDGMADHLILHTSHTGLLFSAQAARQVCAFLATGRFSPS